MGIGLGRSWLEWVSGQGGWVNREARVVRVRTRFVPATDAHGERIVVAGGCGQRTYPYDYAAYDMHDAAVAAYVGCVPSVLWELPHPRRTLSRSGRGYVYEVEA